MDEGYHELTEAELAQRWRDRALAEHVAASVAEASRTDEYATIDSALRWLLQLAWHDLQDARLNAINGRWSINCDGQVDRIVGLTKLTGPAGWEAVPVDLILDGIYEQIHDAIGTPTPLSDDDRARAQAVMDRRFRHA